MRSPSRATPLIPRALVLAGRRGPSDPVAVALGASHRALVPVAGLTMLERVVGTLRSAGAERITVSIDEPELLQSIGGLRSLAAKGILRARVSGASPATSVLEFLRDEPSSAPALVTTADHPLLTREMVESFWNDAAVSGADVAVGVVSEKTFRARYPDAQRTFVRLADEAFSGANLFAFLRPHADAVADFWRRAERHRKRPWQLARTLGLGPLIRFATGRLTLADALDCVERATGARAAVIALPFAEAAIDVDRPADFALAAELLGATGAVQSR